jgi:hypothetical protein
MIPGVIDCFDGLLSSFYPPDFAGIENVAVILIEDAITIEKYCRTLQISHARVGGDNVTCKQYADLRALLQQARDEALGRLRLVVTRESETDAMTLKAETAAVSEALREEIAASLRAATKLGGNVELVGPGVLPNDRKVIADELVRASSIATFRHTARVAHSSTSTPYCSSACRLVGAKPTQWR